MMKINKCLIRLGCSHVVNINHITDITWEFDDSDSNSDTKITVYFDNQDKDQGYGYHDFYTINEYLDNDEFRRFMTDIIALEI